MYGNPILLENIQRADVRDAAREPATERDSNLHRDRGRLRYRRRFKSGRPAQPSAQPAYPTVPRGFHGAPSCPFL
jgi:hypothetical protein